MENVQTLHAILRTQDMGNKYVDKICDSILDDTFDTTNSDHITAIIVHAFVNAEYGTDKENMIMDIDYAINQLRRAKTAMENKQNQSI